MTSLQIDQALRLPEEELLARLIALPEDQWYERKSGRVQMKDLAKAVIAFANAEGGTIAVGLHDGVFEGVSVALENSVRQIALDWSVPPVRCDVDVIPARGKKLLLLRIDPGNDVHTTPGGECYLRIGDESRKLTAPQQRELSFDRGNQPYESMPVNLSVKDLSEEQLTAYQREIGSSSIGNMLVARDLVTRRGELMVATALLFDERPQREFSSAYVRVIRYAEDDRGVGASMSLIDDERIDGSIPHQIHKATEMISELLPRRQQLTSSGRFEPVDMIPRDAWLEGLVNAVVHRSYSMMGDHVRVELFPHRIEITSPGRFPGLVDPDRALEISRYARNPRIARVCADMGLTRELGEGIKRIFSEMRAIGLTDPIYSQSSSSVTLTLSAAHAIDARVFEGLPRSAPKIVDSLRLAGRDLGTGEIADMVGVARPTALRSLRELAQRGIVAWQGNSERDPRASWKLL